MNLAQWKVDSDFKNRKYDMIKKILIASCLLSQTAFSADWLCSSACGEIGDDHFWVISEVGNGPIDTFKSVEEKCRKKLFVQNYEKEEGTLAFQGSAITTGTYRPSTVINSCIKLEPGNGSEE